MIDDFNLQESFEISPRFRRTIEERIDRLERDAALDEAQLPAWPAPITSAGRGAWWRPSVLKPCACASSSIAPAPVSAIP